MGPSRWGGPLQRRLELTSAHVVFVQEAKIRLHEIADFQAWAAARGWKALVAPCVDGDEPNSRTAGVAILVRQNVGLGWLPPPPPQTKMYLDSLRQGFFIASHAYPQSSLPSFERTRAEGSFWVS